ncbi:hypothetical protein NEPAR04_2302 [Nematocida parisii]|nr:hypothetical protein NEPAR03_2249 [Nematocida parisii]KAI5130965.1 hypothetical protein NEPAR08_2281 [Nematocida parisii]KAI5144988.1 hypothetical protein NEPAR04_2302 [Nematocida parisii]
MKYKEGMPLTSIGQAGNHLLMGGGGGNPLYGFPNRLVLVDTEFNEVWSQTVKEIVVSAKVYSNRYAIVEYPDSFELFFIEAGKIEGPFPLYFGMHSPVIVKDVLYYVREGRVYSAEVSKIRKEKEKRETAEKEENEKRGSDLEEESAEVRLGEGSKVRSLYTNGASVLYTTAKNGVLFLTQESEEQVMLDGVITNYTANKSFGYIIQLKDDESLINMTHNGRTWTVIEPMCITVHSTGDGRFYVGTGTGEVIAYTGGVELWRKKLFPSPVSCITSAQGVLYCTCINGQVSKTSRDGAMRRVVKVGLLCVGLSACLGVTKYYAEAQASKAIACVYGYIQAKFGK